MREARKLRVRIARSPPSAWRTSGARSPSSPTVAATIEQDGDSTRVTLADDGAGIADPAVLLTFGESNWKAGIAEAEDPTTSISWK